MARSKIIIAVGLAGVGKSTVLNELKALADKARKKLTIISYGTLMMEQAKKLKITEDRDKLRHSSIDNQKELQAKAAREIVKMAKDWDYVIVDTHMMINTDEGYFPALPSRILSMLNPSLFVVVEAKPEMILSRRVEDITRKRDLISMDDLLIEIAFSRSIAAACSVLTGAPVKFIENLPGKQVEAASKFLGLVEEI